MATTLIKAHAYVQDHPIKWFLPKEVEECVFDDNGPTFGSDFAERRVPELVWHNGPRQLAVWFSTELSLENWQTGTLSWPLDGPGGDWENVKIPDSCRAAREEKFQKHPGRRNWPDIIRETDIFYLRVKHRPAAEGLHPDSAGWVTLAVRTFGQVTGITKNADNTAIAEFTMIYELTADGHKLKAIANLPDHDTFQGIFRLYDDGWRLQDVKSASSE